MNDDWLRERLQAADPARHLTDSRNLELTEAQMSTTPSAGRPDRTRLALVAAAVAVLVLAGVGLAAGLGGDDEPPTATGEADPTTPAPAEEVTATYALEAADQSAGRCRGRKAEDLRGLDVAFSGIVAERTDDEVVLDVEHVWTAPEEITRVVLDVRPAEGAIGEALPVSFEVGKEYVVAVEQGSVRLCGWTAEASPQLEQEYDAAFAS